MSEATHPPRETPGKGRGRQIDFPGGGRGSSRRPENNLPLQLTSFVGREREMAEVEGLLVDGTRLLTLSGPGGSGKTRLALAVAADLVDSFEDGVWLVELASLSDPDLVPQAVASTLSMREAQDRPLIETLSNQLRSKRMLLILDNCEHLVEGCAALADALLRACPTLQILATSREALGVSGESAWLVPPLVLPDPGQEPPIEDLARYEAIRLFIERARAAASTFELTEQNAPAVVRLCRRLDGMPLAIELAAARVRVLSVEQISSRLEDSFGLLTGGSRTTIPHQRTLRATIDWSHELLSDEEQVLFRRLSVFAGGFTLEAAEEVCAGEGIEREEVLDLLSHLVDKSLVLVGERGGEARYRLLETVRQYGREKLDESGEEPAIRRHHADFFLRLAEQVEPKINSKDRDLWLERLEVEHDNFRAALAWSREDAEGETSLRLAGALCWFWYHREYWSEWRGWLDATLATQESAGRPARTAARAKALSGGGFLAWMQGDHAVARSQLEESVTIWREVGDKQGLTQALRFLSGSFESQGDYAVARPLAEESVKLFWEGEDKFGLGITLSRLGITALAQGDYAAARAALEEGVAICREIEDDWALALALRNLGIGAFRQEDYERAVAQLSESLTVLRDTGNPLYMQNMELLAAAVSMRGDHGQAARLFGAAEALREAVGAFVLPLYRAEYDRGAAASRAGMDEEAFEEAWAAGRTMSPEQAVEYALAQGEQTPPAPPVQQSTPTPVTKPAPKAQKAPTELRIFALGAARVEVAGRDLSPSEFGYAKPQGLLFYLLSHPPRTREQTGLALWPEASPSQLRGSFHEALRRLRKALGGSQWIVHENKRYSFNHSLKGYYFFDVEAFESELREARKVREEESAAEAVGHLKEAVGLYGGDFLEGFAAEGEWALVRQEELRRSYQDALQELGGLLFSEGRYSEAAQAYRKVIAMDRYSRGGSQGVDAL
jgi:predicted ATPase/DNA-binding SARP family transcriptional activator